MTDRPEMLRELWGTSVLDPFKWLEDVDDPAVTEFLEAENDRTAEALADQQELRQAIFSEIRSRVQETDLSVPVKKDAWEYYNRTEESQQYPIHCRRPAGSEAGEEILLDENVLAEGYDYFDLGVFDVSVDHNKLLFGTDTSGNEKYQLFIKDLATGSVSATGLDDVSAGSAWANDGSTFFFVRPDETNRPSEAWRYRLADQSTTLVHREPDRQYFLGLDREKDDSYIHVTLSSAVTREIWLIPADEPEEAPRVVTPRSYGHEYSVAHHRSGGLFVILTNSDAQNFRIMTAPDHDPSQESWTELLAHRPDVMLDGFDLFDNHLVLVEREGGTLQIRVRTFDQSPLDDPTDEHVIDQPESVSTVYPGANPESDSHLLRYGYTSMVTPSSLFSYDMGTRERTLLKQQPVLGGFDPADYQTERLWVSAADGAEIPVSLVWKNDRPAGAGPAVLYGYGAYEISIDPTFSVARLSLLDRGFVFAIAHVRGGGEMGRAWYENGKFEHKVNSFSDFVSCARRMVADGWTTPEQLGIRGGSAGGLLVGAALNLDPDLYGAVVAEVPFVDVLNTMIDTTQQLTEIEWDEWGNPIESEEIHKVMASYTPYENVQPLEYPPILATAGVSDPRVGFWEPAKWVLRLRETTTGSRPILLRTEMGAGHFGSTARHDGWRDEARVLAFLITELAET